MTRVPVIGFFIWLSQYSLAVAVLFGGCAALFFLNYDILDEKHLEKLDKPGAAPSDIRSSAQRMKDSLLGKMESAPTKGKRHPLKTIFYASYIEDVRAFLKWTSEKLPPTTAPKRADQNGWLFQTDYAFSNNTLGFFLLIACLYPLLLISIEYGLFGGSGALAGIKLFAAPEAGLAVRFGAVISIMGMLIVALPYSNRLLPQDWPFFVKFVARLPAIIFFAMVLNSTVFVIAVAVFVAVAFAPAVAFVVASAGSVAGISSSAFAIAGACGVGVAFVGAFAGAFAGTSASVVAGAGVTATFLAFMAFFYRPKTRRFSFPALLTLTIASFFVLILLAPFGAEISDEVFLFLIVLPLCNGVFDYLSFGCTRLLLWRSSQPNLRIGWKAKTWRLLRFVVLDVGIAAALLVLLSWSIIGFMHCLNLAAIVGPSKTALFDIADKLAALTQSDDLPQWVYFMHFSTFAPSLLHLCVILLAIPNLPFEKKTNARMAALIQTDLYTDNWNRAKVAGWQAMRQSMRLILPITIILLLVQHFGPVRDAAIKVGGGFLWLANWFAVEIGAV